MTASSQREYAELLSSRLPIVVRSRSAYVRILKEIEGFAILDKRRSPAETAYYRMLCVLARDYEQSAKANSWAKLKPHEMVRELMGLKGVTQAQLSVALGDRAAASSLLSGRRSASKAQAKVLAGLFGVDASHFI